VDALFKAMSSDFLLREQFVTEPSQILSEYVHGKKLPPEQATVNDQLLYAVMSNQNMIRWLRDYSVGHRGRFPTREKFVADFSRAVVAHDAQHVVLALIRSSVEKQDVFQSDGALLPILFGAFAGDFSGIVAHTEMSTGHGTEMSTGHTTGTEMSTGHVMMAHTEMSTGHGTEMSTGHTTGTEMSTGHMMMAHTEMSTGHGTEMSTGHTTGTEMSTGHVLGSEFFPAGHQRVTLAALVEYARQLRNSGALDVVWSR
jgi:hypothetical protein